MFSLYLRMLGKDLHPLSLLSVVSKAFEKHVNNRIVDHLVKCGLFLISNMVLGLLDQGQISSQLYLIELLGLLTVLGLLELLHLIYIQDIVCLGVLIPPLSCQAPPPKLANCQSSPF